MTTLTEETALSCAQLLAQSRQNSNECISCSGKFDFAGVNGNDVYNISAPFTFNGKTLLVGRVESRSDELSQIRFFEQKSDSVWHPVPDAPTFEGLQDPCITFIGGELVLGGVRYPVCLPCGTAIWRMEFFRGKSLETLAPFLIGPDKMKDIRLLELPDGRIAVFSRPQGEYGGRGTIGFTLVNHLQEITAQLIQDAPLFADQFLPSEWGGANEIHHLANGKLGVLGHIACFDDQGHRHYYAMVFCVDPVTRVATSPEIISRRVNFPIGASKRPDLVDVIFSGGLIRHGDGFATLFSGLSDAEAGWIKIEDPFLKFEQK